MVAPRKKAPFGGPWEQGEPHANMQLCKQKSPGSEQGEGKVAPMFMSTKETRSGDFQKYLGPGGRFKYLRKGLEP